MANSMSKDMTKGSEASLILRFALPMLFGNLLQQLYNIADTIIVGKHLGDDALAAVGATGSITYFFYTFCLGMSIGAGVIVSQYFGAGENKKVKSAIVNSAVVTFVFSIIITVISVLSTRPLLEFLKTPSEFIDVSVGYMRIACMGTLAVAAYNWINAIMRSLGDTKTPLVFLGVASALNVLLDLLFVMVFEWGANGAAIATIIAQFVSAVGCIIYGFSKNSDMLLEKDDIKLDGAMAKKCVMVGVPIAVQNSTISVSMIALQRVTNTFGETVMAAYTATMRIEQLIQSFFSSLNAAVSAFTGQNTGASEENRVVKGYHVTVKMSFILSAVMLAVFWLFADIIVSAFVSGDNTISIAATGLRLNSCFYIFLGLIHTTRGFLNGAGDAGYAAINGLVEVVCRIIFSLILTKIAFIGHFGIWLTTCITWFVTGIISVLRYKQGIWKKKALI